MTEKTYFMSFNGNDLGYGGALDILRVFKTRNREQIFTELFETEEGWGKLYEMFDTDFFEGVTHVTNENKENTSFALFVKHYIMKGYEEFFKDVDKTWVTNLSTSYTFVSDNDTDKILAILKHCAGIEQDFLRNRNTGHIQSSNYYKKNGTKRGREK